MKRKIVVPPVSLPLKLIGSGNEAYVKDANGVVVIEKTCGFRNDMDHVKWLRWVVSEVNKNYKKP